MRTFALTVATTATVTVPDQFLANMRAEALGENPTPFLKEIQKQFPDDDDAFLLAVLQNGTKIRVRDALLHLYGADGIGVRLAPAQVKGEPKLPPPVDAVPLLLELKKEQTVDAQQGIRNNQPEV